MSIADWPAQERPREKLLEQGTASLSDAELLALFLQSGQRGKTAVDLGRELLGHFGGLSGLLAAETSALTRCPGMGPGKAARLMAAREIGVRLLRCKLEARDVLTSSAATRDYLRLRYQSCEREVFSCLFLNNQHHVVKVEEPSQADIAITGKLRTALHTIEVRVLDHLVIGSDTVVSMAERDLL